MPLRLFSVCLLAALSIIARAGLCYAENTDKKRLPPPSPIVKSDDTIAAKFCDAIAPSVQETRAAWQIKRLNELETQMRRRLIELEGIEASAKEWVERREKMMKSASDAVITIYAKMQPESAAAQIAAMEDAKGAAILTKLSPRGSSAILDQMEAARAAKLSVLIGGGSTEEKKP